MLCFAFKTNFYTQNSSKQSIEMIQPKFLKAGDTLAIVAPSGILKNRHTLYFTTFCCCQKCVLFTKY